MSWQLIVVAAAGIASMRAAMDRGDLDEAAHQGLLAGPVVIEKALASQDRLVVLAGIAAAPIAEDRAELLVPLAAVAARGDRRLAIPAAHAARKIAADLIVRGLPDDVPREDAAAWRGLYTRLATRAGAFIEVRTTCVEVAAALDRVAGSPSELDLAKSLADPDPAFRRAVIEHLPQPIPEPQRAPLAKVVTSDADPAVALAAAHVLCADLAAEPEVAVTRPVLDALGAAGLERLKKLAAASPSSVREAARCLAAAKK